MTISPSHGGSSRRVCQQCGAPFRTFPSSPRKYCGVPCTRLAAPTKSHGLSHTPEYDAWFDALDRCRNPKHHAYARYGGRGIVVCERWKENFANFAADMGQRPGKGYSIERMDNDGPYAPWNCKWGTRLEQGRNRGMCYTSAQDAKILEMRANGLTYREIGAAFDKSPEAISTRAYRLRERETLSRAPSERSGGRP